MAPTADSLRNDTLFIDAPLKDAPIISLSSLEDGGVVNRYSSDLPTVDRLGFWRRLVMQVRRRKNVNGWSRESVVEERMRLRDGKRSAFRGTGWSKMQKFGVGLLGSVVFVLCFFGVVHLINVSSGFMNILLDDKTPFWTPPDALSSLSSSLTNLTKDVTPIPCHSHNDYWRRIPLYEALHYGCTGVEADVWLFDNELFIGHSTRDLTINKTFRSMYVDPLVEILDAQNTPSTDFPSAPSATNKNGVFSTDAQQTLVLLVDFKNSGPDIYPVVSAHLSALREKNYLTYYNGNETISGPITVVATGNAPFDLIIANTTYRDIFFDAPLDRLWEEPSTPLDIPSAGSKPTNHAPLRRGGQGTVGTTASSTFNSSNSYYASVSFSSSIGHVWWGKLSAHQLNLIRGQIQGAKKRGLKARYWGTPSWPIGLRNRVWKVLVEEGVGYLSGDDLKGMVGGEWGWESVN